MRLAVKNRIHFDLRSSLTSEAEYAASLAGQ
jgi:hypothetical protein